MIRRVLLDQLAFWALTTFSLGCALMAAVVMVTR